MAEELQYTSLPILLRYADRNAMAFSRETRFPSWTTSCGLVPDAA